MTAYPVTRPPAWWRRAFTRLRAGGFDRGQHAEPVRHIRQDVDADVRAPLAGGWHGPARRRGCLQRIGKPAHGVPLVCSLCTESAACTRAISAAAFPVGSNSCAT